MEQVNSGSSGNAIAVKDVIESPLVIANLKERSHNLLLQNISTIGLS